MKNLHLHISIIASALTFFGCQSKDTNIKIHPMVDGRNTEYDQLRIRPIELSDDVNLYIYQNDSYVWLSYDYSEGSFGTLDMIIESAKLESALNIHVSAQLGEWPVGDKSSIAKNGQREPLKTDLFEPLKKSFHSAL